MFDFVYMMPAEQFKSLGHTQLSTTNRYVHNLKDADMAAAQSFEDLIVNPKSPMREKDKNPL